MKLEGGFGVVVAMVGKNIEECADQVERFAGNIGDLEDGADALGDELCGCLDSVSPVLDKDWDLPRAR